MIATLKSNYTFTLSITNDISTMQKITKYENIVENYVNCNISDAFDSLYGLCINNAIDFIRYCNDQIESNINNPMMVKPYRALRHKLLCHIENNYTKIN